MPGRYRVALLASGAASLLHEVAWNRSWVLVFGAGLGATSTVLAVFMLGLGLGAHAAPRLAAATGLRGARLYAALELALAAHALVGPWILGWADVVHLEAARRLGLEAVGLDAVRLLLVTLCLLPASFAMGATLPAIAAEVRPGEDAAGEVGRLYAWNTAGAVLGTWVGSMVLIPGYGIRATTLAAAGAGGLAAALALSRGATPVGDSGAGPGREERVANGARGLPPGPTESLAGIATAVYAFVGFWGMALETLFARAVLAAAGATVYAFAAVLVAFLGGIAGGAALASRFGIREGDPLRVLARRLALVGVLVSISVAALPYASEIYLEAFGAVPAALASDAATLAVALVVLAPAGVGLGAVFPAAARCLDSARDPAGAVSRAYLANSLAGALGPLAAYHAMAPMAGLSGSLWAGALSMFLAALVVEVRRAGRAGPAGFAALAGAFLVLGLGTRGPVLLDRAAYRFAEVYREHGARTVRVLPRAEPLWYRDGPDASVAILDVGGQVQLRINGKTDASSLADQATQTLLGHLPAFYRPGAGTMEMIGLGAGGSLDAALHHPFDRIEVAELSPTVAEAAELAFGSIFPRAFRDPRARVRLVDGRLLVRAGRGPVDAIVSEPTNLFIAGVANLYTREFFAACRERLGERGLLVQWIQSYNLRPEALAALVRTLRSEFRNVMVFSQSDHFLLASQAPLVLDLAEVRAALTRPGVLRQLEEGEVPTSAEELADRMLAWGEPLDRWAGEGALLTDDHPALEFETARGRFGNDLEWQARILLALRDAMGDHELPVGNVLEPAQDGASVFSAGGLWLASGLGGEAVLRRPSFVPRPGEGGHDSTVIGRWRRSDARGEVVLDAFPPGEVSDPTVFLHREIEAERGAGRPAPEVRPARIHDHAASWLAASDRAVLVWVCPVLSASYRIEARGAGREGHMGLLGEVVARVSCLHVGDQGQLSRGRGELGGAGQDPRAPGG